MLNALGDADRFQRACGRVGDFSLLKFVPAPIVALSTFVAGPDRWTGCGGAARGRPVCGRGKPGSGWACAHLAPSRCRPNLQWPRAIFDAQRRGAANRALLHGWMLGMAPAVHAAASARRCAGCGRTAAPRWAAAQLSMLPVEGLLACLTACPLPPCRPCSLVLEVLPSLMHIAAPAMRPVSQHLYTPAEQEAVRWAGQQAGAGAAQCSVLWLWVATW